MKPKTKAGTPQGVETPAPLPKLRFPEFRNAHGWAHEKLGSITLKVGSGITPTGGEKNYKQSGRPFVRSQNIGWGELLLDDVAFIDEETHASFSSTQIDVFDVLLNITGASIGRSAVADTRIKGGNVNQHVCIIRVKPDELNPCFLNQYLISQHGQRQIDSFQAGGNRQGLNFEQIRSFLIPLPSTFAEQQKIAECLISADEMIAAQARKVGSLKTHKKGLMRQLFPHEGESKPWFRFPEFQNAGAWTHKSLVGVCSMQAGKFVSASEIAEKNAGGLYPCYGGNGLRGFTATYTHDGVYPLIGRQGALCGNVKLATGRFHATEHALVTTPNQGVDAVWLYYLLDLLNLNRFATGQAQPGLSVDVLEKVSVTIPKDEVEQYQIATCLSTLETLITTETQKLEAFKSYKKGLMQQLFPSQEH